MHAAHFLVLALALVETLLEIALELNLFRVFVELDPVFDQPLPFVPPCPRIHDSLIEFGRLLKVPELGRIVFGLLQVFLHLLLQLLLDPSLVILVSVLMPDLH